MLKKIKIINSLGLWVDVWAWVDGVFAVHKSLMTDFEQYQNDCWSVTHIPTGMCLHGHNLSKGEAFRVLDKAKNFTWRGEKVLENYQSCELLNVAPLIHKDMEIASFAQDWWMQSVRPLAEKALACEKNNQRRLYR